MKVEKIKVDPIEFLNKVRFYKESNVTLEDVAVIIECMIKEKVFDENMLRKLETTLIINLIYLIEKRNKGNA